jgi:transposase
MSTETISRVKKQFDSTYNKPHKKELLQEQGWKYVGEEDGEPIFEYLVY